jgi:uncharacterized repeat protein (TIGR03833 family)
MQRGRGRGRSNRGRGTSNTPTFNHDPSLNPTRSTAHLPSPSHHATRPQRPRQEHDSVPSYASLHPGSPVSIVLKQDQPTGHTVKGIVADLLTRGDHSRGVKVRLRDGRVGRVQAMISDAEGERGESLAGGSGAGLGRDGERRGRGGMVGGRVERDIREEDEYLYDESRSAAPMLGLFGALEEADKQHRKESERGVVESEEAEMAVCPVCGEFEGDEKAVAFHVEEHFAG